MIALRLKQNKWICEIREEELEFDTREELEAVIKYLLDLKDKNGRIKKYD